eukprot:393614-Rhodomonas_salina.1
MAEAGAHDNGNDGEPGEEVAEPGGGERSAHEGQDAPEHRLPSPPPQRSLPSVSPVVAHPRDHDGPFK